MLQNLASRLIRHLILRLRVQVIRRTGKFTIILALFGAMRGFKFLRKRSELGLISGLTLWRYLTRLCIIHEGFMAAFR